MLLLALMAASATELVPPSAYDYRQVQIASRRATVAATFAWRNRVMFTRSPDGGRTWNPPLVVAELGSLMAGRHRGPRVAVTDEAIVISAIGGKDPRSVELMSWRSTDFGAKWSGPVKINDVPGSAQEGLHAMAAGPNGMVYSVWLDHRKVGAHLYGAVSNDGGATWSRNQSLYASSICECCHPSVAIDSRGVVTVMWRNSIDGNRDMYFSQSHDRASTWSSAEKLGTGSWRLNACPMDGGGFVFDRDSRMFSVWRRENTVYVARPGEHESEIHEGHDPTAAIGSEGVYVAWRGEGGIEARVPGRPALVSIDPEGQYPQLLTLEDGAILAAWENKGRIRFERLP